MEDDSAPCRAWRVGIFTGTPSFGTAGVSDSRRGMAVDCRSSRFSLQTSTQTLYKEPPAGSRIPAISNCGVGGAGVRHDRIGGALLCGSLWRMETTRSPPCLEPVTGSLSLLRHEEPGAFPDTEARGTDGACRPRPSDCSCGRMVMATVVRPLVYYNSPL